jgi:tyrosine-protein phosphatase SIW14
MASQLPTPPESTGSTPPKVTIAPLPSRLMNYIPPPNYGMVERNTVYRSGFPQDKNLNFVASLKIRSILYVYEALPPPNNQTNLS